MARPKEFCPNAALERAMEAFWERGFEATSLSDLTERMGIQRASLYNAYGDKQQLFRAALAHYQCRHLEFVRQVLAHSPSPRTGIESLLKGTCEDCAARKGCLCVNSAVELAAHDPDTAEILRSHSAEIKRLLSSTVQAGQVAGEFGQSLDADHAAELLMVALFGLNVSTKAGSTRNELESAIELVLRALS